MVDNIEYFDLVCNCKWFQKMLIILFFTNHQEFEQVFQDNKIVKININTKDDDDDDDIVSDASGNDELKINIQDADRESQERYAFVHSDVGFNFIQKKYIKIAGKTNRQVHTHVSKEGSDNLQTMFWDVQNNMRKGGLMMVWSRLSSITILSFVTSQMKQHLG